VEEKYNSLYKNESDLGRIIMSFSILAMIIVVVGLYGLMSFVIRHKTKEIAVRKVMGSSVSSVMGVILKYFFMPITIAIAFSLPVAYFLAHEWLKDFVYRINLSFWLIAFSVCVILIVAFLSMARQTIRAAAANPVESLRLE
jgi:putative ABC transport system permease protein